MQKKNNSYKNTSSFSTNDSTKASVQHFDKQQEIIQSHEAQWHARDFLLFWNNQYYVFYDETWKMSEMLAFHQSWNIPWVTNPMVQNMTVSMECVPQEAHLLASMIKWTLIAQEDSFQK